MTNKVIYVTGLICFLPLMPHAQYPLFPQMRARVESQQYRLDEWIKLEVEIVNRGKGPMYFSDELVWGHPGTLDYVVVDKQGAVLDALMVIDDARLMLLRDQNPTLVRLNPGDSLRKLRKFPVSGFVNSPGEYVVRVRYLARVEIDSHMGLPVWNRESGQLLASVSFKVVSEGE